MRRPGLRFVPALAVATAATVALTSCDQFKADPLAFTRVGETTVMRICLDLTITGVEIEQHDAIVWSASGESTLPAGTEVAFSELPPGLASSAPFEEQMLDGEVDVRVAVSHELGGTWRTFTPLDSSDLEDGVWLDGWGETTAAPCTTEACQPGFACHNNWPQPTGRPTELEPTLTPNPNPHPTPTE